MLVMYSIVKISLPGLYRYLVLTFILLLITCQGYCPGERPGSDHKTKISPEQSVSGTDNINYEHMRKQIVTLYTDFRITIQ